MIAAEGEQKASRALKEAADVIHQSPHALQVNTKEDQRKKNVRALFVATLPSNPQLNFCRAQLHDHLSNANKSF